MSQVHFLKERVNSLQGILSWVVEVESKEFTYLCACVYILMHTYTIVHNIQSCVLNAKDFICARLMSMFLLTCRMLSIRNVLLRVIFYVFQFITDLKGHLDFRFWVSSFPVVLQNATNIWCSFFLGFVCLFVFLLQHQRILINKSTQECIFILRKKWWKSRQSFTSVGNFY